MKKLTFNLIVFLKLVNIYFNSKFGILAKKLFRIAGVVKKCELYSSWQDSSGKNAIYLLSYKLFSLAVRKFDKNMKKSYFE